MKIAIVLIALGLISAGCALSPKSAPIDQKQVERAREELRRALREEPKFIKVHAAEAMLETALDPDAVRLQFETERQQHESEPMYRIGIWRVLARTARSDAERQALVRQIFDAYVDPNSTDAKGAVESLAKLECIVPELDRAALRAWTETPGAERVAYGRWLLAVSGGPNDVDGLAELLADASPVNRGVAAYALRFMPKRLTPEIIRKIDESADHLRSNDLRGHLLSAAYVTATDNARCKHFRERLIELTRGSDRTEKCEALNAFAIRGDAADLAIAEKMLADADPDVRVSAARAVLAIARKSQ